MSCVLLITRDRSTEVLAERALVAGGHDVITADSTDAALRSLLNVRVDAAVLDTTVGEEAMSEFCSWLRSTETGCPVVFLASPGARWLGSLPMEPERDEIVVKPCDGKEIRQAVEKTLNSAHHSSPAALMIGDITLDRSSHELRGDGVSVQLTPTEFRLVQYLAHRRGTIIPTEELLEKVWEFFPGTGSSELVRSHVRNLRSKLRIATGGAELVQTVPRRGYRLV
ncbi:MAG: response regulator transcription factor [Dehalococcoidia bacterium]|nr:response regulator transcription factor [Dehalococcoidia bacterium]